MKKFVQFGFTIGLMALSVSAMDRINVYKQKGAVAILKNEHKEVLAMIPDLETKLREELFSEVQKSPHLRVLHLSGKSDRSNLHLLRAEGDILEKFLQESNELHTLKLLHIDCDCIRQPIFTKLPLTLQNLDLTGCRLLPSKSEPLLVSLKSCPKLTSLVLSKNKLLYNENAEDFFNSLPQTLEILKLGHCTLSVQQAAALFKILPSLKNLRTLDLSFINLAILSSNAFQKCFPQSLERLDLSECEITCEQSKVLLDTMSTLKELQEVHLNENKNIDCTTLKKLNKLPKLKTLSIRGVGLPKISEDFSSNIRIEVDREKAVLAESNYDFLKPPVSLVKMNDGRYEWHSVGFNRHVGQYILL